MVRWNRHSGQLARRPSVTNKWNVIQFGSRKKGISGFMKQQEQEQQQKQYPRRWRSCKLWVNAIIQKKSSGLGTWSLHPLALLLSILASSQATFLLQWEKSPLTMAVYIPPAGSSFLIVAKSQDWRYLCLLWVMCPVIEQGFVSVSSK